MDENTHIIILHPSPFSKLKDKIFDRIHSASNVTKKNLQINKHQAKIPSKKVIDYKASLIYINI